MLYSGNFVLREDTLMMVLVRISRNLVLREDALMMVLVRISRNLVLLEDALMIITHDSCPLEVYSIQLDLCPVRGVLDKT